MYNHFSGQEGDCWYVQLLRRQADDPLINGQKDPKYHGNMHSRSIKDYLIRSSEYLENVKADIIALCKMFNVRAYIRLNKRNYKNIALEMMKHIAEQCASGETFSSPYHLVSSACGKCCQAGENKTWLIDLDAEYLPYEQQIIDMICECEPYKSHIQHNYNLGQSSDTYGAIYGKDFEDAKSIFIKNHILIVPTKSGKHIICKPFNKLEFQKQWDAVVDLQSMKMIDIHKDNPTILYVP